MTTAPNIDVPVGYVLVESEDGGWRIEKSEERLSKSVSWRVTPSEMAMLKPFFDSFPGGKPTEAMRWLVNRPAVRAEMSTRVEESRTSA